MAIDIRATVTCSLGTLISGSISDDYLQGGGLVKTRGSVELSALITPAVGTAVTFSYVKGGVTTSIPRKLRVLSSFADPFRRTTKVELGCKLTYLSDLQEPVVWTAFDDDENNDYTEADQRIVTLPIHASSVMAKCLTELGITAASSPLTNKFSVAEFDFGGGYVQVLGDLLVSESYFGYLDTSEVLQIASLDQDGGTGPVYTSADIVDLGPIGTGQLPGEAVTVSYSTLKLKDPDSSSGLSDPWIYTVSRGARQSVTVASSSYSYIPETITETEYETGGDRRIVKQTVTKTSIAAEAGGSFLEAVFNELGSFPIAPSTEITETENTTYEYAVGAIKVQLPSGGWYYTSGDITRTTTLVYDTQLRVLASFNLPWVQNNLTVGANTNPQLTRKVVVTEEVVEGYTRRLTDEYLIFGYTQEGQQLIATAGQNIDSLVDLTLYLNDLLSSGALHLAATSVTVDYGDSRLNNRLPPVADINNAANAKDGDPNNGWRTESTADLELALGSATAQRRIEFSLAYAPDDIFSGASGGPFTATASDAAAKANRYGRVQNRLLLGNRSGINLQLAPERLPVAPFSPLYVQAEGVTGLYRANGNQWAFDSNGIVCSTDALFWGAAGKISGAASPTLWFPVAPGITAATLPTAPAVVDGAMNATNVVLPYNETAVYDARLRLGSVVTKFEYSLSLLTEVPAFKIDIGYTAVRYQLVSVPEASIALTAATPVVRSSAVVRPPAAAIAIAASVPTVGSGIGSLVSVPAASVAIAAVAPTTTTNGTPYDPDFASVSLLLHMDGTNGSTTFTDTSSNSLTVTANGNAQISTTQSKFGGASGYFDGTGDYLVIATSSILGFGTGDFTIEYWHYPLRNTTNEVHIDTRPSDSGDWLNVGKSSAGALRCYDGTTIRTGGSMNLDTWNHIAWVRYGGANTLYLNGTSVITFVNAGNAGSSRGAIIGTNVLTSAENTYGYIDDLRITKGIARYTADFTPPTSAFLNS